MTVQLPKPGEVLTRRAAASAAGPRSYDAERHEIEFIMSSGVEVPRWFGRERLRITPEAVDLFRVSLDQVKFLDGHDHTRRASVLGSVVSARIENGLLLGRVKFHDNEQGRAAEADYAAGNLRGVSVGYSIQKLERVEDGNADSDLYEATRWTPLELSATAVPADVHAAVRSHEISTQESAMEPQNPTPPTSPSLVVDNANEVVRAERARVSELRAIARRASLPDPTLDAAINDGTSVDAFRTVAFDHLAARSQAGGAVGSGVRQGFSSDDPASQTSAVGDAIYARMTGTAPSERARQHMHSSMIDLMRGHLAANGERLRDNSPAGVITRAMTTSVFPVVLGDAMGRRLGELFRAAESGASQIVATGTVRDFRAVTEARLSSFPSLERVLEDGEIKMGALDDEGEALAIASYGRIINLSFQSMVNDDLGAIDRSIRDIAFATAQLKAKLIVAALAARLKDGDPLFYASHGNLASPGAALDDTTLEAGMLAVSKQTPPGSTEVLGLTPAILMCPAELDVTARKLVAAITPTKSDDVNVFSGQLSIAKEPRLTTATEWYLFCAPALYPTIRFLTLEGFEAPRFEANPEFNRLGSAFRVHWHVGAGPVDYRGGFKNPGSAG